MKATKLALTISDISMEDVKATEARLQRFAPLLVMLFHELAATKGIIESLLLPLNAMPQPSLPNGGSAGRFWIKADHALPIPSKHAAAFMRFWNSPSPWS